MLLMDNAHQFDAADFANEIGDLAEKLKLSPIRKKKRGTIDFTKPKRDILLELMQTFRMKTGVQPTLVEEDTPKSAFERMAQILKEGKDEGEFNIEERLVLLRYCEKCRPVKSVEWSLEKLESEK